VSDVDFSNGTIFVREGKGQKDRVIPVGERALSWLRKYLYDVRPALILGAVPSVEDDGHLFLSVKGTGLGREMITEIVTDSRKKAGVEKQGSAHMFRHTTATLMLENGADVRYVQQMLGHKELSSTQIYTHVAIRKLKEVHAKTHPAKFRKAKQEDNGEVGHGIVDEAENREEGK
jgi:integrase/recombinase XerD